MRQILVTAAAGLLLVSAPAYATTNCTDSKCPTSSSDDSPDQGNPDTSSSGGGTTTSPDDGNPDVPN